MPARTTPPPRSFFRKVERVFVGFVMTVMAIVLERMVLRSIRKEGKSEPRQSTVITSKGGELDMEPE